MAIIIIIAIIVIVLIYVILKPYFIKYDTTLLFTGTLGAGKTLNAVKTAVKIYKKTTFDIKKSNFFRKILNKIIKLHNKHGKKEWKLKEYYELPRLISNIPIKIRGGRHEKWSNVLEKGMLTLEKDAQGNLKYKIPEYSVVLIDEIPQLVDQFNWHLEEIKNPFNEFVTFFRHYIGGKLIITAQSDSQVVKQLRDKMNTFYWLSNFKKFLFFFYKCDICQFISSDVIGNVNIGFMEDNTKTIYGTLFRRLYDSRCYSERYTKYPDTEYSRWGKLKTNKIIRFGKKRSNLDPEVHQQ